jgi:hypothetical protein
VLSARALVGKSVLVGPCRLSLSPNLERPANKGRTIALVVSGASRRAIALATTQA